MTNVNSRGNIKQIVQHNKDMQHDARHNTGNIAAMPSRMRPNLGTKPQDKQDNVKDPAAKKAFKAKYASSNSDAEFSAAGIRRKPKSR